jgi:hypothetical protein
MQEKENDAPGTGEMQETTMASVPPVQHSVLPLVVELT